jgi:hypothetical protein
MLMATDNRFWNIGFCTSLDMVGQAALRGSTLNRAARMPAARWYVSFSRVQGQQSDLAYEWNRFDLVESALLSIRPAKIGFRAPERTKVLSLASARN